MPAPHPDPTIHTFQKILARTVQALVRTGHEREAQEAFDQGARAGRLLRAHLPLGPQQPAETSQEQTP